MITDKARETNKNNYLKRVDMAKDIITQYNFLSPEDINKILTSMGFTGVSKHTLSKLRRECGISVKIGQRSIADQKMSRKIIRELTGRKKVRISSAPETASLQISHGPINGNFQSQLKTLITSHPNIAKFEVLVGDDGEVSVNYSVREITNSTLVFNLK